MAKEKYRLKKDILIPAGTVLENIDGTKTNYVLGNYESSIGLTKDTAGDFTYNIDTDDPEIFEWFEKVEDDE